MSSAAFSPDGLRVVTGSADGTARIWDAGKQAEIGIFQQHGSPIFSASFSPDGRRVLTASYDMTARIWDANSHAQIAILYVGQHVSSAAFRSDAQRVVTASIDGARLWRVFPSTQELVDYAKAVVPRCLSTNRTCGVPASGSPPNCGQREQFSLTAEAPDWCYELNKWPYPRLRFGITVQTANPETRKGPNLKQTEGAMVTHVIKGLPAATAGFAVDDLIIAVDGQPIKDAQTYMTIINSARAEQNIMTTIIRGSETKELIMRPRF